jgi:hypothetical protein
LFSALANPALPALLASCFVLEGCEQNIFVFMELLSLSSLNSTTDPATLKSRGSLLASEGALHLARTYRFETFREYFSSLFTANSSRLGRSSLLGAIARGIVPLSAVMELLKSEPDPVEQRLLDGIQYPDERNQFFNVCSYCSFSSFYVRGIEENVFTLHHLMSLQLTELNSFNENARTIEAMNWTGASACFTHSDVYVHDDDLEYQCRRNALYHQ